MITIDQEFRKLIPPLSPDERAQLEANLRIEGCRDPLVIWQHDGQEILLDGHNRKEICEQYGIPYETREISSLKDRSEAMAWIIRNQLGRRNLDIPQRAALAVRLEKVLAREAKERQREHGGTAPGISKTLPVHGREVIDVRQNEASEQAAKAFDVSGATVQRAKRVERDAPEVFEEMAAGNISVRAAEEIASLRPELREGALAATIANGGRSIRSLSNAEKKELQKSAEEQSRPLRRMPKDTTMEAIRFNNCVSSLFELSQLSDCVKPILESPKLKLNEVKGVASWLTKISEQI